MSLVVLEATLLNITLIWACAIEHARPATPITNAGHMSLMEDLLTPEPTLRNGSAPQAPRRASPNDWSA
jgi:hypothetical protein